MRFIPYAANGAFPLDMSQFPNLFHSTRVPLPECDKIQKAKNLRRYVIILHKGGIYKVDAFDKHWNIRKATEILGDVEAILRQSENRPVKSSVAALTA